MIKRWFFKSLVLSLFSLLIYSNAYCVTEFISVINKAGSEDYNTLTLWEAAMDDAGNIIDGTVLTGNWDNKTGSIPGDGTAVDWDGGSSTGTLIHASENNTGSGGDQYLIDVTGGSLADNDVILDVATSTDGFTIAGIPDSVIITVEVYDDDGVLADTVTIDGLTTDATNFTKITVPLAERHNGTAGSGAEIIDVGRDVIFVSSDETIVIEWLILHLDVGVDGGAAIRAKSNNVTATIQNNVIYGSNLTNRDDVAGIVAGFNNGLFKIYNNIVYDFGPGYSNDLNGIKLLGDGGTHTLNNNTVYGCDIGIKRLYGTWIIKNNLVNGSLQTDYTGTYSSSSTNNLSEDATAPAYGTYYRDKAVTFKDEGSDDFHLAEADTSALEKGADLTTTANMDINNNDRNELNGTVWSIGAHQLYLRAKINIAASEDFNTLTLWEASRDDDPDLVSRYAIEIADLYNDDGDLTDVFNLNGFTTSPSYYVKISSPLAERHDGTNNNAATLVNSTYLEIPLRINDHNTIIEWLIIGKIAGGYKECIEINASATIRNCVLFASEDMMIDSNNPAKIYNNIIYGAAGHGITHYSDGFDDITIYNNSIYNCGGWGITLINVNNRAVEDIQNNLVIGNTNGDYDLGSEQETFLTNGSGDTSGNAGLQNLTTSEWVSVAGGSEDLHLASGSTSEDAGTDLGTGSWSFDIDNRDRDAEGDTWDLGADEFVSIAAGVIKTLNGLAWGSVKTRNGLAVGSVKTLSGAATQ